MIKVVLQNKKPVDVVLHPKQGIQIEETKKYLFDPAVVQKYVDASAENAEASQQIYDQFVAESDEFKEEVKVISRETAKDEVSGVVAEVEANVEIAKEASQSAAESAEKAEQNAAKVPDPYEENTALIYKDGVVQWGKAAAENDGVSITENAKGQIQTIGVIDNNGEATKIWNGTRGEFDALEEKDNDTLYNVVDDETDDVAVSSFEIGDIGIAPLGIDETQNKRRYLNGQVISQAQFASFTAKVKNAILLHPNLSATEENWQAEVTNSKLGQCGKFVIDDTLGTIRLPKVVNINGLQDLALMGSVKAESLPNITGSLAASRLCQGNISLMYQDGALEWDTNTANLDTAITEGLKNTFQGFTLNASLSSSTYQDNAPVQQEAIQYPYFIQVATGVEESVDVTREIQLNNPFFFGMSQYFESAPNNASWLLSNGAFHSGSVYVSFYQWLLRIYNGVDTVDGVSVKLHTEAYGDYDYVLNTEETSFRLPNRSRDDYVVESKLATTDDPTWYRIYKSGWVEQGGYNYRSGYERSKYFKQELLIPMSDINYNVLLTNDLKAGNMHSGHSWSMQSDNYTTTTFNYFARGGDEGIYTLSSSWQVSGKSAYFVTAKTYYYVGEVVQDANLINASKVLDLLAKLEGYDYVVESKEATETDRTWYRKYKSGWVEQGGYTRSGGSVEGVKIPLILEMNDAMYSVSVAVHNGESYNNSTTVRVHTTTNNSFNATGVYSGGYGNYYFYWTVSGQGAK